MMEPDEYYNKRLSDRRLGILQTRGYVKSLKSTLYCNQCNAEDQLLMCVSCKDNVCSTCMNNNNLCNKCNKNKKSRKVSPEEMRNTEYIENHFFKKYICCFLNRNKK